VAAGVDEDDLVARQLGKDDPSQLSEVQDKYKDRIKAKLESRAEELKREREARAVKFVRGKVAYERGQYSSSVTLLEAALNEEGPFTQLGGEIQMWLALAYQACGREEDCIEMYKTIEKSHPLPAIRRQAADLRYIMEAPKLQLGEDEKVQIPVLTDLDPATRGGRAPLPRTRNTGKTQTKPKSWDEEFWENYKPPQYLKNRYVWAASLILFLGIVLYSLGYLQS
jgi:tetratricopeptide (TPR) repeat protein